jgi:triacylglycerol lipase
MSHRIVRKPVTALVVLLCLPMPSFAQHFAAPDEDVQRVRAGVAALGREWNASVVAQTAALYAPLHRQHDDSGIRALREVSYGPAPGQTLDLFAANQGFDQLGPVVVYLHDGADKTLAGTDGLYYANVGKWVARVGGVGVNADFGARPADVRRVLDWTHANVAQYGGDPQTVLVLAHGSSAALLARYLFDEHAQPAGGPGIAGAVLISGAFGPRDVARAKAYRGKAVPILLWSAELDPTESGIDALRQTLCAKVGACPTFASLAGHNHVSTVMSIDSGDTSAVNSLVRFYHSAVHK